MMITIVAMVPTIASLPSLMFPLSLCFFFFFKYVQRFTLYKTNSCTSFKHTFISTFQNTKIVKKCFVKTSLKPYMFRSLLYDHPQGSPS
jgi:hypothetical protein